MKKILIVDDESSIVVGLQTLLSKIFKDQLIFLSAKDGEEAWNLISANPDIEIILSDVIMPNKDGAWLLKQIIDNHRMDLSIFYMTGQAQEADLSFIKKYAIKVFHKPFSVAKHIVPELQPLIDKDKAAA